MYVMSDVVRCYSGDRICLRGQYDRHVLVFFKLLSQIHILRVAKATLQFCNLHLNYEF